MNRVIYSFRFDSASSSSCFVSHLLFVSPILRHPQHRGSLESTKPISHKTCWNWCVRRRHTRHRTCECVVVHRPQVFFSVFAKQRTDDTELTTKCFIRPNHNSFQLAIFILFTNFFANQRDVSWAVNDEHTLKPFHLRNNRRTELWTNAVHDNNNNTQWHQRQRRPINL